MTKEVADLQATSSISVTLRPEPEASDREEEKEGGDERARTGDIDVQAANEAPGSIDIPAAEDVSGSTHVEVEVPGHVDDNQAGSGAPTVLPSEP